MSTKLYRTITIVSILAGIMCLCFSAYAADAPAAKAPAKTPAAKAPAKAPEAAVKKAPAPAETKSTAPADDKTIATVNGAAIKESVILQQFKPYATQMELMGQPLSPEREAEAKRQILERATAIELVKQAAKAKGITVDAAEVDTQIAQFKTQAGSEENFKKALEANNITEDKLKSELTEQLMIQKFIKPTDEEYTKFYEANKDALKAEDQVHARHILVKVDQSADQATWDTAKLKIDSVKKELDSGADFAELAKKYSDCPSKTEGGDLGAFGKENMVKEFADAAFAAEPGKVVGPVKTEFGYHLIKVEEKIPAHQLTLAEVKKDPEITNRLAGEKADSTLAELKKNAKIEILDPAYKAQPAMPTSATPATAQAPQAK